MTNLLTFFIMVIIYTIVVGLGLLSGLLVSKLIFKKIEESTIKIIKVVFMVFVIVDLICLFGAGICSVLLI